VKSSFLRLRAAFWIKRTSNKHTNPVSENSRIRRRVNVKTVTTFVLYTAILTLISGSAFGKYSGGTGTADDPYQIGSATDLLAMAADTGDYGAYFVLIADIDLGSSGTFSSAVIAPDTSNWSSYYDGVSFTGDFNGAGHIISNLSINDMGSGNDYMGLFGYVDGQISNLKLENINIVESGNGACFIAGITGTNDGSIRNCSVTGSISCSGYNPNYIGAIAGYNSSATIYTCFSNVAISTTNSGSMLGGIVGLISGGDINNCYAAGDVSGGSAYYAGGLAGRAMNCTITNCYSIGAVTGGDIYGGLIGDNGSSQINNSYYLAGAGPNNTYGTPLSETQLKQQNSFTGWDFVNIWIMNEDVNYPEFIWQNGIIIKYSGGSGTADHPYKIASAADLLEMAADANDYSKSFIQTADINLAGQTFTTAIISPSNSPDGYYHGTIFTGVYDGNDHKITNFSINGGTTCYLALFGFVGYGGHVKNLGVEYVSITGNYAVAGLAATIEEGLLTNCYAAGAVSGTDEVGGLAGDSYKSTFTSCHATGSVSGGSSAGGLAGENRSGTMTSCYAACSVSGTQSIGGLAGVNVGTATLTDCYATGSVTGTSYYVGGLVGINNDTSTITNCYATGTVSGTQSTGGLAGYNGGPSTLISCHATGSVSGTDYVGGLVGQNPYGILTACYATGSVTGTDYVGGLMGYNPFGTLTSCYATGSASGNNVVGGLAGYNNYGTLTNCYATGSVSGTGSSIGGLVGANETGNITSCYAAGSVSGTANVGGLVGWSNNSTPTNCFWDVNTSGQTTSAGGTGKTTTQMQMLTTFTDSSWDFIGETDNGTSDIWKMPLASGYPMLSWQEYVSVPLDFQVTKCTVAVGSKYNTVCDAISFSGILDADANDILAADNIVITVDSNDLVDPCIMTFPINATTFKKGSYNYTIKGYPFKSTFKFSAKTGKFSLSAKNIDLTGLACPVIVTIQIGGSSGSASLDETIVNGPKKLISYQLMMGAENSLMADKVSFKRSTKPDANSLTVSGRFTTTDGPDLANPMVITVGSQTFTVTGNQFLSKNGVISCKNAVANEGPLVRVTAKLDYLKCTFTISIKYASIIQSGEVDFGIDCFGVNLDGLETIDLGL
jgi:hypothetical protein